MTIAPDSAARTILVAGGAGFLGSHLCEALLGQGHRVICIDSFVTGSAANLDTFADNPRFRLMQRDICQPFEVAGRVDDIYNLACAASPPRYQADPIHTLMTSVLGTRNLLDIAERQGATTFLQASTSEIYGDPEVHPQPEGYNGNVSCTGPRACYDEGKRAAETLCFDMLRLGRVDVRVARIFNTYGPRMQPDDGRIVSTLLNQAIAGEPLTIFGTGEQTRSFCYVSDLIEGLMALMRVRPNPRLPVNLGNPGEFTINELARLVLELTGSASTITHLPLPEDDPQKRRPDISRARKILGWAPKIALRSGLRMTIAGLGSSSQPSRGVAAEVLQDVFGTG